MMPLDYKKFTDPMDDRRRKIHPDQHGEIRRLYESEGLSQREIAKRYGVDKSTIGIIVNPDRAAAVSQRIKDHWKDYSNRADLTAAARKLRKRKREMGLAFTRKEK